MDNLRDADWQITHHGVQLLAFTDLMAGEPKLPRKPAAGESVARARAQYITRVAYGSAENSIEFTRVVKFASALEARNYLMGHNASLFDGVDDVLIETRDGDSYTLTGAQITALNPRVEDGGYFACDYTLTGGALTEVGGGTFAWVVIDDAP